jgi:hypothetical protein
LYFLKLAAQWLVHEMLYSQEMSDCRVGIWSHILAGKWMHLSVTGRVGRAEPLEPLIEGKVDYAHLLGDVGRLDPVAGGPVSTSARPSYRSPRACGVVAEFQVYSLPFYGHETPLCCQHRVVSYLLPLEEAVATPKP